MRNRLLVIAGFVFVTATASYAQCTSPCQTFTSGSGLSYPTNASQNNVAWAQITVPTSSSAPGFSAGTTINHITVTLNNWSEAAGGAALGREFLLQAPGGQTFEFAAEVSTGNAFSNITWTFDDSAASNPPGNFGASVSNGTFKPYVNLSGGVSLTQVCENYAASAVFTPSSGVPSNYGTTVATTHNQNCAQQSGSSSLGSTFNGLSPLGTWTVWEFDPIADNTAGTVQNVSISITPSVAAGTTTTVSSSSPNNESLSGTSVTFTATVTSRSSAVTGGTVAFSDGNSNISGCSGAALNGSGQATCTTSLIGEGNHVVTATYSGDSNFGPSNGTVTQFVDNQTVVTGSQFCNNGTVTLNEAGSGGTQPGAPYPQHVFVTGLSGSVTGVALTLQNVNAYLEPLRILLVGPDGKTFVPLAGAGGLGSKFTGNLLLGDSGGSLVPQGSNPTAGTSYLPTDYVSSISFPAPAPAGPYKTPGNVGSDTFAATFASEPVNDPSNDKWSLFVSFNQGQGDTETTGGYCLTFTTSNLPATTTSVAASPQMQATTGQEVTFTATVTSSGTPVTGGTVKFEENGTVLSGPTPLANGQAAFTTSSLTEGIHSIEALYSGVPGSFNVSSGTVNEEIDTPTTNPVTGQYCNPGGLTMGTVVSSAGETATPYPSRINVTNLAGTVQSVSVALNGFTDDDPLFTLMMLEGPTGSNIVFWDDAGGTTPVSSPLNITFSDSAAGQLGVGTTPASTSYLPTANNQNVAFPFPSTTIANQPPPTPSFAASLGSQTLTAAFQNLDPNNYWSLFWIHRPGSNPATIGNWCLNFVENPPVLTINKAHSGNFTQGDTADTYTITVANPSGPGSTGGALTLTDTLPTGMSPVSMSQTGGGAGSDWSCTANSATCTRTTPMPPGESDIITLTVGVGYSAAVGNNSVTNSVSVSGGGISATQTATDPTTILPGPGYALTTTVNPSGAGTVGTNPGNSSGDTAGHYTPGATVTLTATASTGYTFSSWSGSADLSSTTANPTTIIMNSATESVTANFTPTPSAIAANAGTPQNTSVGTAFPNALQVKVTNVNGAPAPNALVTFTAPTSGASATFPNGNTATTDSNGLASVNATANTVAGSYSVTASVSGVATPASFSLTNNAGAAASISVTGNSGTQSVGIGTAFAPLQIIVKDASNNPVPGVSVTFTAPSSGASGTFSNSRTTINLPTSSTGTISAPFTANSTAGAYTVTATVSGIPTPANFSLTNTAGSAAHITVASGSPQAAPINTSYANLLIVTVTDSGGNPVSSATVTYTAPAQTGPSVTFSGGLNTAQTNNSGQASIAVTANSHAGPQYTVSAAAGTVTAAAFQLTNTPGPAAHIAGSSGSPQTATINTAFASALVVTVTDAGSNPVAGAAVTFTAGSTSGGASATLSTPATTNTSGQTSVTATANTTAGGPYTVTASVGGVSTPASFSLTNTPLQYQLSTAVSPSGGGTVTPTSGTYVAGTQITLTATPNIGYSFANWTGTTNSSSNPLTETMNGAVSETANFTQTAVNVSSGVTQNLRAINYNKNTGVSTFNYTITNKSTTKGVPGPIQVVMLSPAMGAVNNTGTVQGDAYWTINSAIGPKGTVGIVLEVTTHNPASMVTLNVYSGHF